MTYAPRVHALYFSPTGGTANASSLLAHQLSTHPDFIDQTCLASRTKTYSFGPEDLVLMAAPSFSGRVPYAPGLFTNLKGDQTPCVIAATYGNRACEHNLAQMYRTAVERGFLVVGAITIVTPHILGIRSGHSRPDGKDRILLNEFAQKILAKLAAGNRASIAPPKGDPSPTPPPPKKPIPKHLDRDKCTRCGSCAAQCPEGAIDPQTLDIDENRCIQCQRCSYVCLPGARFYTANWDGVDAKCYAPRKEITYWL